MATFIPHVAFNATCSLQLYLVPVTGTYLITAAGAEGGGHTRTCGGKGALLRGHFHLKAGDVLHFVVGKQGEAGSSHPLFAAETDATADTTNPTPQLMRGGGGGGGTFIWRGSPAGARPAWPLLAAGGGGGGGNAPGGDGLVSLDPVPAGGKPGSGGCSDAESFYYTGGGGTGWHSTGRNGAGPTYCQGGGHWQGGAGARFGGYQGGHGGYGGGGGGSFYGAGSGGGGGYTGGNGGGGRKGLPSGGGGSYNAGRDQVNLPGCRIGDGFATVAFVPIVATLGSGEGPPPAITLPRRQSTPPFANFTLPLSNRWQFQAPG